MLRMLMIMAVALLGLGASPAAGQDHESRPKREREDVHLRNDCRLAVQVLTDGQPADKREWALGTIARCDESGPPVLARMWQQVAADSASVGNLIYRSVGLRDRRLYDVVFAIAGDRSVPALKRAAALHLLGRWAEPGFILVYRPFFAPGYEPAERRGGVSGVTFVFIDHDTQNEGAEPLPATIKADVLQLARDIAAMEPNYRLRAAADVFLKTIPK
jgi:hypothetical protein